MKKKRNSVWRFVRPLLFGAIAGAIIGAGIGYFGDHFSSVRLVKLLPTFIMLSRSVLLILILSFVGLARYIKKYNGIYQNSADDASEELYRSLNRKQSYAVILTGCGIVLALLNTMLGISIEETRSDITLAFPLLDMGLVLLVGFLQMYALKLYNDIRGLTVPLLPSMKELKQNILQMDEAELQAQYKASFDIVMNLSGLILPGIYLILFFVSLLTHQTEIIAFLVTAGIHLYIMVMQVKMTRNYYK